MSKKTLYQTAALDIRAAVPENKGQTLISALVAKDQGIKIKPVIAEHVFIALLVVAITHFLGDWVNSIFVK